jgi:hypothetical protein
LLKQQVDLEDAINGFGKREVDQPDTKPTGRRPSIRGTAILPSPIRSEPDAPESTLVAGAAATELEGAYLDRKLHILLYSNVNDGQPQGIGLGAERNQSMLKSLFEFQFRGFTKQITSRTDFSSEMINRDLAGLKVAKTDAVLVYISTHGAFVNGEHQMSASGSNVVSIRRPNLIASMRAKAGGDDNLRVLITDSCGSILGTPPRSGGEEAPDQVSHELFRLMMTTAGEVNVNAAIPGRFAFYTSELTPRGGGLFTKAFVFTSVYGAPSETKTGTASDWLPFFREVSAMSQNSTVTAPLQPPACWFDRNGNPKSL